MPKISKATVVQDDNEETKPVRKKAKQKSQGSLLSESSSGTSAPTPNNNLESWTDPMEPSDQAAISDAGKVPSGKNGDSTAPTSKRPTPARNAKGRWARKSRAKKTPADKQGESKDDQSDANSQLIIGQDVAAGTADLITGDTNCCPASALDNDETQPDRKGSMQNRQRSPLSESNSGTSSPTPKINLETPPTPKFWNSKQGRWTVVIPDDGKVPSGTKGDSTASTAKRPIPARNAKGRWARKPRSRKTRADMQDESKDVELPIQICSLRTRKRAAQESIFDPNQIIKTEVHDFELPIQWATVKKEVPDSELPFQSGSQSSGKNTASESIFDPNWGIVNTEVPDTGLPIQTRSQSSGKKTATESIFDPNQIIKTEVRDFELSIQWGTVKKESELPFQSGSQSSERKTAADFITESNSCAEFTPNKTVKKEGDSVAN